MRLLDAFISNEKKECEKESMPLSIIQFPEMSFTGYTFDSREEIERLVERDDEEEEEITRQFLSTIAKRFKCLASAGYVRGIRDANEIYNAVQIVDETGISVLIIEHNMDFILRQGVDRIVVMNEGEVLMVGTPDEVRSNREVIEAYLGASGDESGGEEE